MIVKKSTIDTISRAAPKKYINELLNKAFKVVPLNSMVDISFLSIGEHCLVAGVDSDMIYLNVYRRVS